MARIRYLKPEFFDSETVAAVGFTARLLFAGLWTLADREGRLELSPRRIKARIFPYDDVQIEPLMDELLGVALVIAYEAEGRLYAWIPGFAAHQRPHPHEAKSTLPACPASAPNVEMPWKREMTRPDITSNDGTVQPSACIGMGMGIENGERTPRARGLSITQPRDLHAFWEGPVFNVPQRWADASIRKSNGRLDEAQLRAFAAWATEKAQRERTDVQQLPNFLGWLDEELRTWRGRQADERVDRRAEGHLAMVEAMKRGEYDR